MEYRFITDNESDIKEFDEVLDNMLKANEAIKSDKMTDMEIIEYIKGILRTARTSEYTNTDLFWGFGEPSTMPGDSRVYYFYNPTYYNVIFMISAYLKMPERLEAIEGFMDVFSRGLDGATNRGFKGHGYDDMRDFRKIMKKFIEADVDIFVERYPHISDRFTQQFTMATGFIRDMAELHANLDNRIDKEYRELNYYSYRFKKDYEWKMCWISSDIDAGIRDAIIKLNHKGYYTVACCEGHPEKIAFEYAVSTYIYFEVRYEWPVEPPFISATKGIRCKKYKNGLYWETRRRVIDKSKVADHQTILEAINKWVDELPCNVN